MIEERDPSPETEKVEEEEAVTTDGLLDLMSDCIRMSFSFGDNTHGWGRMEKLLRSCDGDTAADFGMDLSVRMSARILTLVSLQAEAELGSTFPEGRPQGDHVLRQRLSDPIINLINMLSSLQTHHAKLVTARAKTRRSVELKNRGQAMLKVLELPQSKKASS